MRDDDLPWMRLHIGDYLRDTLGWPPIARLILFELLVVQWNRGELPAEPDQLRLLVAGVTDDDWRTAWTLVERLLPFDGDVRRNPNIAEDRERAIRVRKSRQRAANTRWSVIEGGKESSPK